MNNNKPFLLLLTVGTAVSFILGSSCLTGTVGSIHPLQIQTAMAQNDIPTAIASLPTSTTATNQTNSSITLGNPDFTEQDKATPPKPVIINGVTHGLQTSYSGSGTVKGVNFSVNGTVFIVPRIDGSADLIGHANIATTDGEKGTYSFYSLGHMDNATGSTKDNGAAFFHTNSSGKLSIVKDLVIVFKDQNDKAGNGKTVGWEWK
ncbi:MAG TPA: hypothetical protein VE089_09435 [Nitrososphaeraceae archaeon]|nr:hypothetical protein [Nitrososphaeraceae archaeon]